MRHGAVLRCPDTFCSALPSWICGIFFRFIFCEYGRWRHSQPCDVPGLEEHRRSTGHVPVQYKETIHWCLVVAEGENLFLSALFMYSNLTCFSLVCFVIAFCLQHRRLIAFTGIFSSGDFSKFFRKGKNGWARKF